jgi:hypothetical protein
METWCSICEQDDCYHLLKANEKPWDPLDQWIYRDCPDCGNKADERASCETCKGFGTVRFQCKDIIHWKPKLQPKPEPKAEPDQPKEQRRLELE